MNIGLATTIAFLAIGANGHANMFKLLGNDVGHIEMITDIVEHADYVERLYEAGILASGGCPGVFDYEVAEVAGRWYIDNTTVVDGHVEQPTAEAFRDQLRQLAFDFFSKNWHDETDALARVQKIKLERALAAVV